MTLIGALIPNSKSQAVTDIKQEELTYEVQKHNNFAPRIPVLERNVKTPTLASKTWNKPPNGSEHNSNKNHRR